MPKRVGPFERPTKDGPLGQVGRRPSSPAKLLVFAAVYLVCGVLSFVIIGHTLGIILGIVLIGIGLLWFRGAATAQLRQQNRHDPEG
jgi:Flp pilus assembly protein TadB